MKFLNSFGENESLILCVGLEASKHYLQNASYLALLDDGGFNSVDRLYKIAVEVVNVGSGTLKLVCVEKEGFDIESHKRLANLFDELTARGCYCMLTNHNTDLINELYGNKGYKIDVVSVKRMINSDASNRVGEEVIICNY